MVAEMGMDAEEEADAVTPRLEIGAGLEAVLRRTYGGRLEGVLCALTRPPSEYAIRVNTLRTTAERVADEFAAMGVRCGRSAIVEEAVVIYPGEPRAVERRGKMVVADKFAAESVMLGSKLYEPGILRAERVAPGDEGVLADPQGHVVGTGIARFSSARRHTAGIAVDTRESVYSLPPIRESRLFGDGMIQEQSLPAMVTSMVLDPQPKDVVVDLCAAPGNKCTHVAQIQGDRGLIYAFEHSPKRLRRMRGEIRRLGIRSIRTAQRDSRYIDRDFPELRADRVLVDPPCTALGVRPKLYEETEPPEVESCAAYQKQFLRAASRIVKKGGTVVYSTCTLPVEEDEAVVGYALDELGLELDRQSPAVGGPGIGGGRLGAAQRFDPDVSDTPGYFIAKFVMP